MPTLAFDTLDAVPEGLREFAKEADGKVTVKVVAETKLDEFRTNNVALSQERDVLNTRVTKLTGLVGEDPDQFATELATLRETAQKVKDGQLQASDDVDRVVQERVSKMKEGFEEQLRASASETAAWKTKATTVQGDFDRSIVDQHITTAVIDPKVGALTEALPDILHRARGVFQVENGKLVPRKGEAVIYGADGATPMTPAEWLAGLKTSAPYFFKGSGGGGATGDGPGTVAGMSQADFLKLPAHRRLELANQGKV